MKAPEKSISVTQAAVLCGVGRTTVGYWIRSRKLRANRVGRNYTVPVEELIFFLKKTNAPIPPELAEDQTSGPCFRSFQNCWQYHAGTEHGRQCSGCIVHKNRLDACFTARDGGGLGCPEATCNQCLYHQETYMARIQFIQQIELPAAIYRGLYFWGANRHWAALCGRSEPELIGLGIEHVFHSQSLEAVISDTKKRDLGDATVSRRFKVFLRSGDREKMAVRLGAYPLNEPEGTFLLLAEPDTEAP
ncbi:MAG: helix-turn-helix domain-containing protein [Desulfobacterales bacterium]|nr:helix-turn-helix domain-containing protein [Desulfobacterales bacterium]